VSERWICNRCYTSAEASATACPNCGLERGLPATPEAPEPPQPADPVAGTAADPSTSADSEPVSGPPPEPASEPPNPVPNPTVEPVPSAVPGAAPVAAGSAMERWVCLRCFASNDGAASACATCGQPRGEAPESAATGEWAASAASPAPTQGRRFPWRWVIYGVIVLVVVGAGYFFAARRGDNGEVTDAGDLSVFDLQVGDCFDVGTDQTEVETVRAIPCDEPHTYELFWTDEYPSDVQPSEDESLAWLEDNCLPEFEEYVGLSYQESIYYMGSLSPTDDGWSSGDRGFSCYLYNASETPMSGSVEGTAQ
jgi:ribosomal protein L40E